MHIFNIVFRNYFLCTGKFHFDFLANIHVYVCKAITKTYQDIIGKNKGNNRHDRVLRKRTSQISSCIFSLFTKLSQ